MQHPLDVIRTEEEFPPIFELLQAAFPEPDFHVARFHGEQYWVTMLGAYARNPDLPPGRSYRQNLPTLDEVKEMISTTFEGLEYRIANHSPGVFLQSTNEDDITIQILSEKIRYPLISLYQDRSTAMLTVNWHCVAEHPGKDIHRYVAFLKQYFGAVTDVEITS
jgi:hypothetical protein